MGSNLPAWLLHRRASGALTSPRGGERGSAVRALVPGFRHPLFFFCSSLQERTTAVTVRVVDCVDNACPRRSEPLQACGQLGGATRGQLGAPGDNSGTAPFGPQEGRLVPGCIPGCGCSCTRVLHRVRGPKLPRSDNFSEVVHRPDPSGPRERWRRRAGVPTPGRCSTRPLSTVRGRGAGALRKVRRGRADAVRGSPGFLVGRSPRVGGVAGKDAASGRGGGARVPRKAAGGTTSVR